MRCEIDMKQIKEEFQKIYSKSMESFIKVNNELLFANELNILILKGDCSGDYKRALLCLVGDSNWK